MYETIDHKLYQSELVKLEKYSCTCKYCTINCTPCVSVLMKNDKLNTVVVSYKSQLTVLYNILQILETNKNFTFELTY